MVRRKRVLKLDRLLGFTARADRNISGHRLPLQKRNEPTILPNRWLVEALPRTLNPVNLRRHRRPARVDSIQRFPQEACSVLGRIQSRFRGFGMGSDPLFELIAPHLRVMHIGGGV